MKNSELRIYAGHCSANPEAVEELYEIARMHGIDVRIVGLKSRTLLNTTGVGMGMDYATYTANENRHMNGVAIAEMETHPSVDLAVSINEATGCSIATEIMNPTLQLPQYAGRIPAGKLLIWNPSVNQLGWPINTMGKYAKKYGWTVGIKNGKWIEGAAKTWAGLQTYAEGAETILIHRGFEDPAKGDARNLLRHDIAMEAKKQTGCDLYLDPSHAFGPKMRDHIVPETIKVMQMLTDDGEYLYNGILIEVGTSETDTDQHISIRELQGLIENLSGFRQLLEP